MSMSPQRLRLTMRGAVQGVGFRPHVYRLATELGLTGWVRNSGEGVVVEAEGPRERLERLLLRIEGERPPRASIHGLEHAWLDPARYDIFEIRASLEGEKTALILPDVATCAECLHEVLDPSNRRYLYPFTNCTNCGPRFTIIESLPYDRVRTTMRCFAMCAACRAEYETPRDRRFHAEPNACPRCGPTLVCWDRTGRTLAAQHEALLGAAEALRKGSIVAVKGTGGFHLMVDACNDEAVRELRRRKAREEKPFALLVPSLARARGLCAVSELEARLLCSPEAPIVLVPRRDGEPAASRPSACVAPGNPLLGVMLPSTPLHHLLARELDAPLVATSGNLSDEPICTDEREAVRRLRGIADLFLVHDRPIARHADDSVVRMVAGRELILRRARGYAPLSVRVRGPLPPLLAVGGHAKSTVAVSLGSEVVVSQHLGDLDTAEACETFRKTAGEMQALYDLVPVAVACDRHPDYASTRFARASGVRTVAVQHHYAHVLACMAENEVDAPCLGVAWDGAGLGLDGTLWGGEFLRVTASGFERAAHLRTFALPGGEKAIREPRRAALGLLCEIFGDEAYDMRALAPLGAFTSHELTVLRAMLDRGVNCPRTSSAGRLFDAVASVAGLRQRARFEGQAAMDLEFAIGEAPIEDAYQVRLAMPAPQSTPAPLVVDWAPLIHDLLRDLRQGTALGDLARKFHDALVEAIVSVARRVGEERVVLSGGCFQNAYLLGQSVARLRAAGFNAYRHQRVPPNDGGIALGQVLGAARALRKG